MKRETADYLIIGAGIVGLNIAIALKTRFPKCSVALLEKEKVVGLHASGRNSGVIHAGLYYTKDSLKARFAQEGNLRLRAFIKQYHLQINPCGKLVVAKNEADLNVLEDLLKRGEASHIPLEMLTAQQVQKIEPRAKTFKYALWSPTTATADPGEVIRATLEHALKMGISVHYSSGVIDVTKHGVATGELEFEADYIVNAAGLYADKIAHLFGHGMQYCILPFKGLFLIGDEPEGAFNTNIYPVPDLKKPFLGVHITVGVNGKPKIGPTAVPALWREQYGRMKGFCWPELIEMLGQSLRLMVNEKFNYNAIAIEEFRKYNRKYFVDMAHSLAHGIHEAQYRQWGRAGIRAQLLNKKSAELVMDFHYEGDSYSFHVLNAVSPGWTCAAPFAEYLVEKIEQMRS